MRLLITGGAGFVGAKVTRLAVEAGYDVLNFDALTEAASLADIWDLEEAPNYRLVPGNVCDRKLLTRTIEQHQPQIILHLAQQGPNSLHGPMDDVGFAENVSGTKTLLQAAARHWRQQGRPSDFKIVTAHPEQFERQADESLYETASRQAYNFISKWQGGDRPEVLQISACALYGPRQTPTDFVPATILAALQDRPIASFVGKGAAQEMLFVQDFAKAILDCLPMPNDQHQIHFNGMRNQNSATIARLICQVLDKTKPQRSSYCDLIQTFHLETPTQARTPVSSHVQDLADHTPIEDGLAETVDWFVNHELWWRDLIAGPSISSTQRNVA